MHCVLSSTKLVECISSLISLILPCLRWRVAAFLGVLPPPVDLCNSVKPLAGMCIALPVMQTCVNVRPHAGVKDKQNGGREKNSSIAFKLHEEKEKLIAKR